jgi:tetratricopeptide (TPR) repeat protein
MMRSRFPASLILAGLILISAAEGWTSPQTGDIPDSSAKTESKPASKTERLRQWRTAAAQHHPGQPDSEAAKIGRWREKDLEFVINYVTNLAAQPIKSIKRTVAKISIRSLLQLTDQEVQQGDLSRVLKQGALLHTDIALLDLGTGESRDAREGMGAFVDGRIFLYPKTPHWEFARRLVDSVSPAPSKDPAMLQWYIATTAYMQGRRLLGYARHNLDHAMEKFPADPRILFYAGALHETWASTAHQNVLQVSGAKILYGSKESELKLARQFFDKAIAQNPAFSEAHLRLGRVLGLLGNHEQAVAELQQASAALKDRQLLYYASLYLGFEFEMLCRRSEARDQYERAAALYPAAQSPLLALSQLARSDDDVKGALLALDRVFALPRGDLWKDDPWWVYNQAHVRDAVALIEEMYRILGERTQ